MKNIFLLLSILLFVSCGNKEKKTPYVFSDEEAYAVINTFIADQKDKPILWNNRQLLSPPDDYKTLSFKEVQSIPSYNLSFPLFTKAYWKMEQLKNTILFDSKEYDYFFVNQNNDEKATNQRITEWQNRFKDNYLYNVSYPMYNKKAKIAIIAVYYYKIPLSCYTNLHQTHFYKKTAHGWTKNFTDYDNN
ncbi:hypothetical protein [Flavobacterium sp. J27]|uniref:hypothetical protein n=1 Tax=Flavobacterium sp. J27 TaxID=2060419 RepID=UPI001030C18F|nr:hypothetical protein [Flavobacterium sp. J27]